MGVPKPIAFGPIIHVYRLAVPLTHEQLAERMAVRPDTVRAWEEGKSRPNLMQVPLLCAALGISYEEFFGGRSRSRKRRNYYQLTFAPVLSNYVIATVRKRRGISLKDFAGMLGITEEEVALLEAGKKIPRLEQVPQICRILGIRLKRFFE